MTFPSRHILRPRFLPVFVALCHFMPSVLCAQNESIIDKAPRKMNKDQRNALTRAFEVKAERARKSARTIAASQGWSYRGVTNGMYYELDAIENGKVYMDASDNRDAAITAASDQIRDAPFELTGLNIPVGIWEAGGLVMSNHQEYAGRVLQLNVDSLSSHAAHVAGTIGAIGISNRAKGMAPGVIMVSLNSSGDEAEMAFAGRADPGETNVIQISNHSYGSNCGWQDSYSPTRWFGLWPASESDNFGIYESQTRAWDVIAYAAPYYLIFKSAGNNRNDSSPTNNEAFQYYSGSWKTTNYNASVHPPDDGWDNGGYDTISPKACAKNIMTVGATSDAETGGGPRTVSLATITTFSGWGPCDDGRIKPDIVANGQSLYSCDDDFSNDYTIKSGTSMSTPSTCGSAALLLELQDMLFTNYMLASTIKGLLLHSADDTGRTGPDYIFGWGLLNVRNAAEHLVSHFHNPDGQRIVEDTITDAELTNSYSIVWRSNGVIKVTLCWTDPPGTSKTGVDNTNLALVNDLDLKLIDPDGATHLPWILDPLNPTNPATTGVNFRDNVEQVCLTNASATGVWTVVVSSDDALTDAQQTFSLFITGHDDTVDDHIRFAAQPRSDNGIVIEWGSKTGKTYEVLFATNLMDNAPFTTSLGTFTGEFLSTVHTDTTAVTEGIYRVIEQ